MPDDFNEYELEQSIKTELEEVNNEIVLTIKEALTIIEDDLYQIEVLRKVLRQVEDIKRLVA